MSASVLDLSTLGAGQGRASVGQHVDATAVAAVSSLILSARASQLLFDVRTVRAVHGRASVGHLRVDATAVAAVSSLILSA